LSEDSREKYEKFIEDARKKGIDWLMKNYGELMEMAEQGSNKTVKVRVDKSGSLRFYLSS